MKTCSFNVSDKRKDKITAKFQSTKRVPIEHTKRFLSPEKFRDFRENGPQVSIFFSGAGVANRYKHVFGRDGIN